MPARCRSIALQRIALFLRRAKRLFRQRKPRRVFGGCSLTSIDRILCAGLFLQPLCMTCMLRFQLVVALLELSMR